MYDLYFNEMNDSTLKNVYLYLSNNQWTMSATLPRSIRISLGEHVTLESYLDRPYKEHHKHKKTYKNKRSEAKGGEK